jgi:pilus assembly protein Flp/PilA
MNLINRMRALLKDDSGQDLLEYALLTALIALAAVTAIGAAGTAVNGVFVAISNAITAIPA